MYLYIYIDTYINIFYSASGLSCFSWLFITNAADLVSFGLEGCWQRIGLGNEASFLLLMWGQYFAPVHDLGYLGSLTRLENPQPEDAKESEATEARGGLAAEAPHEVAKAQRLRGLA